MFQRLSVSQPLRACLSQRTATLRPAIVGHSRPFSMRRSRFSTGPESGKANESSSVGSETSRNGSSEPKQSSMTVEEKLASVQESYLRALADMENLRQRTRREIEAAGQYAIQKFAKDIISVADILEMAVGQTGQRQPPRSAEEAAAAGPQPEDDTPAASSPGAQSSPGPESSESLLQGMQMTLEEFGKVLRNHGVTPIDPLHQRFDPHQHMALYEVPTVQVEPGTIVSVQKRGYLLNGRVIRAAQVAVARKP